MDAQQKTAPWNTGVLKQAIMIEIKSGAIVSVSFHWHSVHCRLVAMSTREHRSYAVGKAQASPFGWL